MVCSLSWLSHDRLFATNCNNPITDQTTLLLSMAQTTAGHAKVVCPPQLPFCISIGPHRYVMHHWISSHQRRLRTSRQRTPCSVPNVGSAKQSTHPYDTRCSCSHLAKLLHKHGNNDAPQRPGLTTRCPVRLPQRVYTINNARDRILRGSLRTFSRSLRASTPADGLLSPPASLYI